MPRIQLLGGQVAVIERLLTDPDTIQYGSNEDIIQSALKSYAPPIISTDTLLQTTSRPLSTGCPAFDNAFFHGEGMQPGQLIEFCGSPASGKTQLCLTMAATTSLRGQRVVYIDTANGFSATRVSAILQHHLLSSVPPNTTINTTSINKNIDQALACVEVHHCHTIHALLSLLELLLKERNGAPSITYQNTKPSMVIVDSLSSLVGTILGGRQHFQGHALLSLTGVTLKKVASQCKAAVIVTNHLVGSSSGGYSSGAGGGGNQYGGGNNPPSAMTNTNTSPTATALMFKKPAMGESWRCQPHVRIQLVMGAIDGDYHEHQSAVVIGEGGSGSTSDEGVGVACLLSSTRCPPGAQMSYRIHGTRGILAL